MSGMTQNQLQFLPPKSTSSVDWSASTNAFAQPSCAATTNLIDPLSLTQQQCIRKTSSELHSRSSPPSSVHSSLASPTLNEQRWTSFDEDSDDDDENNTDDAEDEDGGDGADRSGLATASDRLRHGRSPDMEHQTLLDNADDDQNSIDTASLASDEDVFSIRDDQRTYYTNCFKSLQMRTIGFTDLKAAIPGDHSDTMDFFDKSGLTREELSRIWTLADVNGDGFLNLGEFYTAMHLTVLRVKCPTVEMPEHLPPHLVPRYTPPRESAILEASKASAAGSSSFANVAQQGEAAEAGRSKQQTSNTFAPLVQNKHGHVVLNAATAQQAKHPGSGAGVEWTSFGSSVSAAPVDSSSPRLKMFTDKFSNDASSQPIAHPIPLKISAENIFDDSPPLFNNKIRTVSEPPVPHFHSTPNAMKPRPRTQTTDSVNSLQAQNQAAASSHHHQPPVPASLPVYSASVVVSPIVPRNASVAGPALSVAKQPLASANANAPSVAYHRQAPLILSPKEEPPPPPPPRPYQALQTHKRSASLDLTQKQKELNNAAVQPTQPAAALTSHLTHTASQVYVTNGQPNSKSHYNNAASLSQSRVNQMVVAHPPTAAAFLSSRPPVDVVAVCSSGRSTHVATVDRQTQTDGTLPVAANNHLDVADQTDVGLDRKRHSSAPMLEMAVTAFSDVAYVEQELSDLSWRQRCNVLANVNQELEKQLVALTEQRLVLEAELQKLK